MSAFIKGLTAHAMDRLMTRFGFTSQEYLEDFRAAILTPDDEPHLWFLDSVGIDPVAGGSPTHGRVIAWGPHRIHAVVTTSNRDGSLLVVTVLDRDSSLASHADPIYMDDGGPRMTPRELEAQNQALTAKVEEYSQKLRDAEATIASTESRVSALTHALTQAHDARDENSLLREKADRYDELMESLKVVKSYLLDA